MIRVDRPAGKAPGAARVRCAAPSPGLSRRGLTRIIHAPGRAGAAERWQSG